MFFVMVVVMVITGDRASMVVMVGDSFRRPIGRGVGVRVVIDIAEAKHGANDDDEGLNT